MEMSNAREHFRLIAVSSNNTTAVAEYTDYSAMLPVSSSMFLPLIRPLALNRIQSLATDQTQAGQA